VPIRPNTDCALLLGMAHAILAAGREDRAFLARCTVGWERLRAYILGEADGQPKTPEWAEAITEVPAAAIRRLALAAAGAPTLLTATWSTQRSENGEQPWWMLVALAAMLGTDRAAGQGVAFGYGSINGMGTPRREMPSVSLPPVRNPCGALIPCARVTELLERPGGVLQYNGRDLTLPDIRMIFWAGGNPFHHHQDLGRLLRAWNRAETIVVSEPWWTAVARHADIVLPATTSLERNDIASSSRDRFVRAMHQAIPPVAQARNDVDAFADIADALGYRDRFTEGRDEAAWLRHLYGRWRDACMAQGFDAPEFDRFWAEGHVEVPAPRRPSRSSRTSPRTRCEPAEHAIRPGRAVLRDGRPLRLRGGAGPPRLACAARVAGRRDGGRLPAAPAVLPARDAAARAARLRAAGGGGEGGGAGDDPDAPGGRRRARADGRRGRARPQRPRRLCGRAARHRRHPPRRRRHADRRLVEPGRAGRPRLALLHGNPNVLTLRLRHLPPRPGLGRAVLPCAGGALGRRPAARDGARAAAGGGGLTPGCRGSFIPLPYGCDRASLWAGHPPPWAKKGTRHAGHPPAGP
jgi:hypothetical protein